MSKIILNKIIVFILINCFTASYVFGENEFKSIIDDLKNSYIEKDQFIEIKLVIGKNITIKFIEKTEYFISGYLIKFDQGAEKTTEKAVKIYYNEIKSYQIIYKNTHEQSKTFYLFIGLSIVFLIIFVKTLQQGGILWTN